jgi:hypothetical protein
MLVTTDITKHSLRCKIKYVLHVFSKTKREREISTTLFMEYYTLFTNYLHNDKKMIISDSNETTNDNKRKPIRSKRMNKRMIGQSVIYIDIKCLHYKEESL